MKGKYKKLEQHEDGGKELLKRRESYTNLDHFGSVRTPVNTCPTLPAH